MTDNVPAEADATPVVTRDNLNRFVKGVSGNPKGRPKGSRNRASVIREALEEATLRQITHDIPAVLDKAIDMALKGNEQMIKLLLKDVVLKPRVEEDDAKGSGKIVIEITNLTVNQKPTSPPAEPIEGEFTTREDSP